MDLSARGHEQAATLARHLSREKLDAVYASPMKRVQQTLGPLLGNGVPDPVVLHDLREVDFGDWTGLVWEEIQTHSGISAFDWLTELERGTVPNAESGAALRARVEPCLQRILRDHAGQTVAVFSHGGVIRMLLGILLGLPLRETAQFEIDHASVTRVAVNPDQAEIELLNFTPWRDRSP